MRIALTDAELAGNQNPEIRWDVLEFVQFKYGSANQVSHPVG